MGSLPLNLIRAIYFDLDDTLCAYWDAAKIGLRRAFEQHGPEQFTVDQMVTAWAKAFRGFGHSLKKTGWYEDYLKTGEPTRTEQMRLTLAELGCEDSTRAGQLSCAYAKERDKALYLFPETIEVLEKLQKSFTLGLITNGPADIQRQEINTLKIEDYFKHTFIEGEMGFGKPDVRVFELAQKAVGYNAEEILMVGNSYSSDIYPAIQAGWQTAWVRRSSDIPPSADPKIAKPEEKPIGKPDPTICIQNLCEIFSALHL